MQWALKKGFSLGGRIDRTLQENVAPSFEFGTDEYWMEQALLTAMNAVGWSAPNPSVGCVIVHENEVLATGFTQAFKREHAERMAFQSLDQNLELKTKLSGATAYVTLEPCSHVGHQPPCVDLLINSPICRVVVATQDPDERVSGRGIQKLKDAGKEVVVGVLQNEAQAWHFPFLKNRMVGKPVWIAKWAQTESGHMADADGNSKWITNAQSRAYTHWLRQKYDAILIGAQTYIADQPSLTVRDCATPHRRNPHRLIFDPKAKLSEVETQGPMWIYVEAHRLKDLPARDGVTWIGFDGSISGFQKAVEDTVFDRPLQSIFCEGGATLLNLLMRHNIFDVIHRFQGTKIFEKTHSRYQVEFVPGSDWFLANNHQFQDDDLQEWVKCF